MKHFVDLQGQLIGMNFAWFDTVSDKFETHDDCMAWDTWEEFIECYAGDEIERYEALTPDWVWELPAPAGF